MDNWRKKREQSHNEECKFQPEIHENKFKDDKKKAEDIVLNPEALNHFLKRNLGKKKEDEAWKKIVDKRPGNGAVYINKLTIPQNIKLCTSKFEPIDEKLKIEDFLDPKSKNKRATSEYRKNKLSMDSIEIQNLIKKSKEDHIGVKIPMRYEQAKDYLKNKLYSIDLIEE